MTVLRRVTSPRDLDSMNVSELRELAAEIRVLLIDQVSSTGGHLGPNLGVVELTLALHRVFDSPREPIIWDVGHQTYVHKIVTGRKDLTTLRSRDGLGGYPLRSESEHDIVENSHGSVALSWADGVAHAFEAAGDGARTVAVVVGDGALTGGVAWEALSNIAASGRGNVVIVVNDNGRSYAPTIGGLARALARLRRRGRVTRRQSSLAWRARRNPMFPGLKIDYLGPVDGHDLAATEALLREARNSRHPVIVHVVTEKGRGYLPALRDEADRFHAVGRIDPETGAALSQSAATWTEEFEKAVLEEARRDPKLIAVTAAMLLPTGLGAFREAFPHRVIDVGMAEQHAVASAAGLAYGGLHPVVALYSTFLNRAYDQLLFDVALHRAGVTFVLDRAGATGPDGASHHGMWDLVLLQTVPGMRIAVPRDAVNLRELLTEALAVHASPTAIRFPRGEVITSIRAERRLEWGADVLREVPNAHVLLITVGATAPHALEIADRLSNAGVTADVLDPRWVTPVPAALAKFASHYAVVATLEDGVRSGGVGSRIQTGLSAPDRRDSLIFGLDDDFLPHASRQETLHEFGMATGDIVERILTELDATTRGVRQP